MFQLLNSGRTLYKIGHTCWTYALVVIAPFLQALDWWFDARRFISDGLFFDQSEDKLKQSFPEKIEPTIFRDEPEVSAENVISFKEAKKRYR